MFLLSPLIVRNIFLLEKVNKLNEERSIFTKCVENLDPDWVDTDQGVHAGSVIFQLPDPETLL